MHHAYTSTQVQTYIHLVTNNKLNNKTPNHCLKQTFQVLAPNIRGYGCPDTVTFTWDWIPTVTLPHNYMLQGTLCVQGTTHAAGLSVNPMSLLLNPCCRNKSLHRQAKAQFHHIIPG